MRRLIEIELAEVDGDSEDYLDGELDYASSHVMNWDKIVNPNSDNHVVGPSLMMVIMMCMVLKISS